jgi:hypothetical protein
VIESAVPSTIGGVAAVRHTCERSWRVIMSMPVRPRCVASTRCSASAVRFITKSTSAKAASMITPAIHIVVRSSGRVKPPSLRSRRLMPGTSSSRGWTS